MPAVSAQAGGRLMTGFRAGRRPAYARLPRRPAPGLCPASAQAGGRLMTGFRAGRRPADARLVAWLSS
jgi:hypothetical protein